MSNEKTTQECIERGWVNCPKCQTERTVDLKGQVAACNKCGDSDWWNLMVTTEPLGGEN